MMSVPSEPVDYEAKPAEPSRVRLKPTTSTLRNSGYVDGAWWPRSRDLTAESPALFAALAARLGGVERMAYHLGEWQQADRRLEVGAMRVRLGGFNHQSANTVDIVGSAGQRITLLVVPPETSSANAEKIALAASDGQNVDPVAVLLARVAGRNGMPRPAPAHG
jgi:hypothetical protein